MNQTDESNITSKPIPGTYYFRFVGDTLIKIRLLRIKNDNCFVMVKDGMRYNMTKAELKTYKKLNPDGYVSFLIADLDEGIKDTLITFHRKQDLSTKDQIPFAVCRQNIYDPFTNAINKEEGVMYVGASISQDNCPADIPFELVRACNGVSKLSMVSVYIEDTLNDILSFVNLGPYNEILFAMYKGWDKEKTRGACEDVPTLLRQSHFIDDIYYAFNEVTVGFKYVESLEDELIHAVEDIIKREMIAPVWVKFDRDIDLTLIEDKYIIIRDIENNLYIISYKEGSYVNRPYFAGPDTTEYDTLKELLQNDK